MTQGSIDARDVFLWGLGAFLLIGLSFFSTNANVPEAWAPFPAVLAVPGFVMHPLECLWIGPLILLVGTHRLLRGDFRLGNTGSAVCAFVVAYGVFYVLVFAATGINHQGGIHVLVVAAATVIAITTLGFLWRRARSAPSFTRTLVFYWVFSAWLVTYGFPWLGELL